MPAKRPPSSYGGNRLLGSIAFAVLCVWVRPNSWAR